LSKVDPALNVKNDGKSPGLNSINQSEKFLLLAAAPKKDRSQDTFSLNCFKKKKKNAKTDDVKPNKSKTLGPTAQKEDAKKVKEPKKAKKQKTPSSVEKKPPKRKLCRYLGLSSNFAFQAQVILISILSLALINTIALYNHSGDDDWSLVNNDIDVEKPSDD